MKPFNFFIFILECFFKSTKKKQLEEELTKIKEEFKEYSGLLVASCEKKNVDLVKEISQIKEVFFDIFKFTNYSILVSGY